MQFLSGIVACMLLGLAACELGCFHSKLITCELEFYIKHGLQETSFCKIYPYMSKCVADAANECSSGFAEEAERAHSLLKDLCTGGSKSHEVLKNDDNCGVDTFTSYEEICGAGLQEELDGLEDYLEHVRVSCSWNDRIKKCMHENFSKKCTKATQDVFREIYDASYNLQKKMCEEFVA